VWNASKKISIKFLVTLASYVITLFADWLTIFLSPTQLDFAFRYYAFIAVLGAMTAVLFQQFDTMSVLFALPYVLWLIFMALFCHTLFVNNRDNKWFSNEDLAVDFSP
jgi:tryptophan-rich sensory protein